MKIVSLVASALLFSTAAFAASDNENLIASALISQQIEREVSEFNQLVEHVSSVKVESVEDLDTITLEGMILRGGDIACGSATLKITKTFGPVFGFNRSTVYKAEVINNEIDRCR